jgi:hypothetical protein
VAGLVRARSPRASRNTSRDPAQGPPLRPFRNPRQSVNADGTLVEDFSIGESPNVLHVRNAPSPAATASLAIGREISEMAIERFGLN